MGLYLGSRRGFNLAAEGALFGHPLGLGSLWVFIWAAERALFGHLLAWFGQPKGMLFEQLLCLGSRRACYLSSRFVWAADGALFGQPMGL